MKIQFVKNGIRKGVIVLITTFVLMPLALIAFLMFASLDSHANMSDEGNILLAYTAHDFDKTLALAKQQLAKKGFQVAHVQRCDNGLKKMGYEVSKYQVVFFGRFDEVREMTTKHVELAPFLPFKLLIYVEGDKTGMSIMNPEALKPMITDDKELTAKLTQWREEFVDILTNVSQTSLVR